MNKQHRSLPDEQLDIARPDYYMTRSATLLPLSLICLILDQSFKPSLRLLQLLFLFL